MERFAYLQDLQEDVDDVLAMVSSSRPLSVGASACWHDPWMRLLSSLTQHVETLRTYSDFVRSLDAADQKVFCVEQEGLSFRFSQRPFQLAQRDAHCGVIRLPATNTLQASCSARSQHVLLAAMRPKLAQSDLLHDSWTAVLVDVAQERRLQVPL